MLSLVRRFVVTTVASAAGAGLIGAPAGAALIVHKDLTLSVAKTLAEATVAACAAKGCGIRRGGRSRR